MPGGSDNKSRRRRPEEFGLFRAALSYEKNELTLERYRTLRLAAGLSSSRGVGEEEDSYLPVGSSYLQATSELLHVMLHCLKVAEKPAAAAIYADALLSARLVAELDTAAQLAAAARLQRAARLALPQAKYKFFDNAFRKAAMAQKRRAKKADVETRETNEVEPEFQPLNIAVLPVDVLDLVLARLGPHDLARASCVSRAWRELSHGEEEGGGFAGNGVCGGVGGEGSDGGRRLASGAWKSAGLMMFGERRCEAVRRRGGEGALSPSSSWRHTFLAARRRCPAMALEPTGRVLCTSCRRLLWESEVDAWPRTCRVSRGIRVKSRFLRGGGGGGGDDTDPDTRGARSCHATVRFPAHRVVGYLLAGTGSESDDSGDETSSSDDDCGGGGDGGSGGMGQNHRRGHRLWRIPTPTGSTTSVRQGTARHAS